MQSPVITVTADPTGKQLQGSKAAVDDNDQLPIRKPKMDRRIACRTQSVSLMAPAPAHHAIALMAPAWLAPASPNIWQLMEH